MWMHVPKIRLEGTVSQNVVLGFSFYLMSKNGFFFPQDFV